MEIWVGILTVLVAILFLQVRHLRKEVSDLKKITRIEGVSVAGPTPKAPAPDPQPQRSKPDPIAAKQPPRPAPPANPWAAAKAGDLPPLDVPPVDAPPKAIVMRASRFSALGAWIKANSFYAISAVSLALAGIFLVQYSISNGLLPPFMRVAIGLAFGAVLILAGEFIRRRYGDQVASSTAYLPSIFSGAGVVTLFAAFGAARILYELIPPGAAFGGLVAVAILSVVLGWLHGPLLVAIGILGGFAAPFVATGSGEAVALYPYFAALTAMGLFVDAARRWAWVSVLALVIGVVGGVILAVEVAEPGIFTLYLAVLLFFSITIPTLSIFPRHPGPSVTESLLGRTVAGMRWPAFPTRLAFGMAVVFAAGAVVIDLQKTGSFWLVPPMLAGVGVALMILTVQARSLADLALPVVAGFVVSVVLAAEMPLAAFTAYQAFDLNADVISGTPLPRAVTALLLMAVALTLAAAYRTHRELSFQSAHGVVWAAAATLIAPVVLILLEIFWSPAQIQGQMNWALHAIALAALMTLLAERFWKIDQSQAHHPTALAMLSALSLIALSLGLVLVEGALTLALAAMIALAAAIDRRFNLSLLTVYISLGLAVLGYRLVLDPGLIWALNKPVVSVSASFIGSLAAMAVTYRLLHPDTRARSRALVLSALWSTAGIFATVMLNRFIAARVGSHQTDTHWALGLFATVWLIVALTHCYRLHLGGPMRVLRIVFAVLSVLLALIALGLALSVHSPLSGARQVVVGPVIFNTLLVAYGLPALVLALGARLRELPRVVRRACAGGAVWLGLIYAFLAVRHFWRGAEGMTEAGTIPAELYSYTILLLLLGAASLVLSFLRRSKTLRLAGLFVIGLAVAKVFLIDISGLGGLIRVFSFLALGLALAGLAWLNRWIDLRISAGAADPADPATPEAAEDPPPPDD